MNIAEAAPSARHPLSLVCENAEARDRGRPLRQHRDSPRGARAFVDPRSVAHHLAPRDHRTRRRGRALIPSPRRGGHLYPPRRAARRPADVAPHRLHHRGYAAARVRRGLARTGARHVPADAEEAMMLASGPSERIFPPVAPAPGERRADGDRTCRRAAALYRRSPRRSAPRSMTRWKPAISSRCAACSACARLCSPTPTPRCSAWSRGAPRSTSSASPILAPTGAAVEFTRSYYRADTYDFVSELTLSPANAQATQLKKATLLSELP